MMQKRTVLFGLGLVASITALAYASDALDELSASNGRADAPIFEVDPFWPQPLPNHWCSAPRSASASTPATTSTSSTDRRH